MLAVSAELAANGITTAILAQFWSWEGGMRGPEFASEVLQSVDAMKTNVPIDMRLQLRLETHFLDELEAAEAAIDAHSVGYVVFNDHLPHDRLAQGRKPPRMTGQALKSRRSPDDYFKLLLDLHARGDQVDGAMDAVTKRLGEKGVTMGSHDDRTAQDRAMWRARGARVSEFPETSEAAQAARDAGDFIVLGAPNVVRGASHTGNASALDLIAAGLCDALASDYHYPSAARAAWRCVELGVLDDAAAWRLVSDGPAHLLGLQDRGQLQAGKRADLVIMVPETRRIVATIAQGQVAWMTGAVAERFI
jgi:alpha-D-ribose 1-methylphosphonate 5-triphosphate diphosphatase